MLIVLAAVPATAQQPSITVGDWLRVDFKARFQADIRTIGGVDQGRRGRGDRHRPPRVGVEGRVAHVDYQVEYEIGAREWRDVYLDYRQFKPVQVRAGAFKLPFGLDENTSPTKLDFIYRVADQLAARARPRPRRLRARPCAEDMVVVRSGRVPERRRQRAPVEQRARVRQTHVRALVS